MQINRTYSHKRFGEIGSVVLVTPDGDWSLNGTVLPAGSVEHLANFALQTLQDAYAGSENTEDAIDAFNGKLGRIIEGSIGVRGEGAEPADPVSTEAARIAREWWKSRTEEGRKAALDRKAADFGGDRKAAGRAIIAAYAKLDKTRATAEANIAARGAVPDVDIESLLG